MQRIDNGQRMTIGEVKRLLTTAAVDGRILQFYELDGPKGPIASLAQARNDDSLAITFVRAVLANDQRLAALDPQKKS